MFKVTMSIPGDKFRIKLEGKRLTNNKIKLANVRGILNH
jgi:hypothetical protein